MDCRWFNNVAMMRYHQHRCLKRMILRAAGPDLIGKLLSWVIDVELFRDCRWDTLRSQQESHGGWCWWCSRDTMPKRWEELSQGLKGISEANRWVIQYRWSCYVLLMRDSSICSCTTMIFPQLSNSRPTADSPRNSSHRVEQHLIWLQLQQTPTHTKPGQSTPWVFST